MVNKVNKAEIVVSVIALVLVTRPLGVPASAGEILRSDTLFEDLLSKAPPNQKQALQSAQEAWDLYVKRECSIRVDGLGSARSKVYSDCVDRLNTHRKEDLEFYYKCREGDLDCPNWAWSSTSPLSEGKQADPPSMQTDPPTPSASDSGEASKTPAWDTWIASNKPYSQYVSEAKGLCVQGKKTDYEKEHCACTFLAYEKVYGVSAKEFYDEFTYFGTFSPAAIAGSSYFENSAAVSRAIQRKVGEEGLILRIDKLSAEIKKCGPAPKGLSKSD